ncbi:MAG TPA: response regulator, partial [Syntrophomonas sp.]|nr:response regulator [Syntrophomonas sp.]
MNILVCDDDKEILDAIGIYLKNEGYTVFKATNGLEALPLLEENPIHLVIMDIMMPK